MNKLALGGALVAASLFSASSSQATTVPLPSATRYVLNQEYDGLTSLAKNTSFVYAMLFKGDGGPTSLDFVTLTNFKATNVSSFKVQWKDMLTNVATTICNITASAPSVTCSAASIPNILGHDYNLLMSGRTDGSNAAHNLSFQISAVPVPPALGLLISGLAGIGVTARGRKRKAKKLSV